ncbi:MAG: hypothetical protein FWG05_05740, partial [Kiritimatiellaeota bacterium]|nr:hypothetical protein [Kiritimatiellota bacterium]
MNLRKFSILIAVFAALALAACSVVLGSLNHDEGWYLLAGINTFRGMLPYRDYMFTQGPVMAAVYAVFAPLWSPFGALGGRVFTLTLSAVSLAMWCAVAKRLGGRGAALTVFLLLALNPVYSYFTVIPKTYALSGLFIAAAFNELTSDKRFRFESAAVLLALAAGTRLSLGILLAVVGLWLLLQNAKMRKCENEKTQNSEIPQLAWLRFGVAGVIALAVIYAPFFIVCREQFIFSQTYHAARTSGGFFSWVVLRGGFVSRILQGYFPILVTLIFAFFSNNGNNGKSNSDKFHFFHCLKNETALVAVSFVAVSALHFLTPFPYDDYQTPVMPLAAVFAAVVLCKANDRSKDLSYLAALCLCFLVSSPMLMNWMMIRQDRFWFDMKKKPDIFVLRETAKLIRNAAGEGESVMSGKNPLLTQDAYLAVEARMSVPRGLEMGPFSFFPELSDEEALKHNVHNANTLREMILTTDAQFAAFSGYAFAISCPTT